MKTTCKVRSAQLTPIYNFGPNSTKPEEELNHAVQYKYIIYEINDVYILNFTNKLHGTGFSFEGGWGETQYLRGHSPL